MSKKLKDEDIRFLLKKTPELKGDVAYEPAVESPYETLIQYLDKNQVKVNYFQINDVNEALVVFLQKKENNGANSVFLVGKVSEQINKRSKRDIIVNDQNTTIYGTGCAAFFTSINVSDNTVSGQSVQFSLPVDSSTTASTCTESNGTVT